ncbi:hypothetical protein BWD42_11745 [Sphingobacterium sp. CZ-UAM]|uniref:hypothetical protein n=1 Tax=Sphingobacterium sp. CZ-UAM TaxID=1933868 RepID=UPI0009CAB946|nr:hypothetical protein [Sphingobacterium sp. CZ-UAM]OOG17964.1 hypothetical protein BWD42_11745 [Sphingobacterium sp. CZ-UAM]
MQKNTKQKKQLTPFGEYLAKRSVNKSEVCRKVGISITRLNRLCYNSNNFLRCYELQLISLAINEDACKMQQELYGKLQLQEEFTYSEQIINNFSRVLNDKGLITTYEITQKDIERIASILPFCVEAKSETEILELIGLKRRSSKLVASIKACVEAGLLSLHMKNLEGNIVSEYILTDLGKQIIEVDLK